MRKFFLGLAAFLAIAGGVSYATLAYGEDGINESQVQRFAQAQTPQAVVAPTSDAQMQQPTTSSTAPMATQPSTVTVTTPAADPVSEGLTWIVYAIFGAIGALVTWLLGKTGLSRSEALGNLNGLADNVLDLAADKVSQYAVPVVANLLHGTIVGEAFTILEPIAAKEIKALGWSEDTVKAWLSSVLAPTSPAVPGALPKTAAATT